MGLLCSGLPLRSKTNVPPQYFLDRWYLRYYYSAPSGTILTGSVMSLLSLAGDRRVLFGYTSTFRLAFLGARFWCWRSSTALLHPIRCYLSSSPLLAGDRSSLEALLCCALTGNCIPENPNIPNTQTTAS